MADSTPDAAPILPLQLCRPLSGAVIGIIARPPDAPPPLQLCRPLSGAVMLDSRRTLMVLGWGLQLCRPLSGAVIPNPRIISAKILELQLCRPLSGAVMP